MHQDCATLQHENLKHKQPQTLTPYWPEEAVTFKEAAALARVHEVRAWARTEFLGRPVGPNRWKISKVALAMYLESNASALTAYLRGDRSSPAVVAYYERLGLAHLVKNEGR